MKTFAAVAVCLACFSGATHANTFTDLFDGVTVGAGYASDSSDGNTFGGYSIYSQGPIIPSLKDYLFTDFRVTHTSNDLYDMSVPGQATKYDFDVTRYQASVGAGYPFHVVGNFVVKPYATVGWSWDKAEAKGPSNASIGSNRDNSFLAGVGVRGEFGQHFVTGVGYSKETSGFKADQWMLDVGYRF